MKNLGKQRPAFAVIAGLMLSVFSAPVIAQGDKTPAPWITMTTTSGCGFYLYNYDDPTGAEVKETPWTWTGGCTNGLASGFGDLTTALTSSDGTTYTSGYRGTLVNGHRHGRFEEITNGKMLADYYWTEFNMGCGQRAIYVYCQPATVTQAPPTPVPHTNTASQTPNQTASSARLGTDTAAILAALGGASEDRVFAMLAELIETGQIDLAREAERQLARRYPNSPLISVARQLLDALKTGSSVSAAASSTRVTHDFLRQAAEATYGNATNISSDGVPAYEVMVDRDGTRLPVVVELSGNMEYLWVSVRLTDRPVSPEVALLALQRVKDLQPTMMWEFKGLRLGRAITNEGLTAEEVRQAIDQVTADALATIDLWGN
ncbi:hypothetical protein ACQKH5_16935 [Hyphomonas sp. NPDC076900]|uniref:tetratricopeptide repeat protein n=1 Tax=unclassified Hyphomonas TaxID=2630699 RepID=UPI003D0532A7